MDVSAVRATWDPWFQLTSLNHTTHVLDREKQRINLELSQLREKQQQKEQEMEVYIQPDLDSPEQKRIAVEMKSKLEQQNRLNEERIQREKQEAKERLLQLQQDNRYRGYVGAEPSDRKTSVLKPVNLKSEGEGMPRPRGEASCHPGKNQG
eukprot:82501-Amorphochlora_amoeboformis.AAC.1